MTSKNHNFLNSYPLHLYAGPGLYITGARLLSVQVNQTPGLYAGPGVYPGPGFYPKFYGNPMSSNKPYKTRTVKKALIDKLQRTATQLIKNGQVIAQQMKQIAGHSDIR